MRIFIVQLERRPFAPVLPSVRENGEEGEGPCQRPAGYRYRSLTKTFTSVNEAEEMNQSVANFILFFFFWQTESSWNGSENETNENFFLFFFKKLQIGADEWECEWNGWRIVEGRLRVFWEFFWDFSGGNLSEKNIFKSFKIKSKVC